MYPLDQVLKPDFSRSWQEAVALVQEVALALGDLKTLAAPEDLFLEEDATVAIGFASEEARDPVTSLAALLLQLLDGINAPAELRSLAADNAKTPPAHATVAGFTRALAFYERPDRQSDVRAVLTRLAARRASVTAEEELERLRQRVAASVDELGADEQTEDKKHKANVLKLPRLSVRELAIAAGILVALLGALAGAGLARGRSVRTIEAAAAPASNPEARSSGTADRVNEEPGGVPVVAPATEKRAAAAASGSDAAPSARLSAPAQTLPTPPRKSMAQRTVTPSVSRPAVREPAAIPVPHRPRQFRALPPVAPLLSSVRSGLPAATDAMPVPPPGPAAEPIVGHVYSAAEPNVKPARLARSQLPQEPAATADTGYFDIVVDEQGDVESVKLLSPTRRYQDRMLVAAAKAWKFKPALLNGSPVKYRLRIPIIVSEMPRPR